MINFDINDKKRLDYNIVYEKLKDFPFVTNVLGIFTKDSFLDSVNGFTTINTHSEIEDGEKIIENNLIQKDDLYIGYTEMDGEYIGYINFYSKGENDKINEIIENLKDSNTILEDDTEEEDFSISYLSSNQGNYNLSPINISERIPKKIKLDKKVYKDYKSIIKAYDGGSGMYIFWGERGLGKTNLSLDFFKDIKKDVIFIPNNLIDVTIQNPEFLNFLKGFDSPAILIDDVEFLTNGQFSKMNLFTSNLLQLLESPISMEINLLVLLIFNLEKRNFIDNNLLDSNSLISDLEFKKLDPLDISKLKDYIDSDIEYKNKVKLIDILKYKKEDKMDNIGL